MGHGEEIVFADAHFPAGTLGVPVLRADGVGVAALLDAVLPLFELDGYVEDPLAMMRAVEGDSLDPAVEREYLQAIRRHAPDARAPVHSSGGERGSRGRARERWRRGRGRKPCAPPEAQNVNAACKAQLCRWRW
jgi:hypothetical protein